MLEIEDHLANVHHYYFDWDHYVSDPSAKGVHDTHTILHYAWNNPNHSHLEEKRLNDNRNRVRHS